MKTSLWNAFALAHLSLIIGFHPWQGSMNHPDSSHLTVKLKGCAPSHESREKWWMFGGIFSMFGAKWPWNHRAPITKIWSPKPHPSSRESEGFYRVHRISCSAIFVAPTTRPVVTDPPLPIPGSFSNSASTLTADPSAEVFLCRYPPENGIEIIPGNGEKRYREGTENESRLPPTSDPPNSRVSPCSGLRGPPIPVGRSLPEGKKPRVEDRRRCPEKARVPPGGFPKPPFSSGEVRPANIGAPTSFGSVSRPAHAPGSPRCGSEMGGG